MARSMESGSSTGNGKSGSVSSSAFQLPAAVRTSSGDLIAPVFWSDNWIELTPGGSTTLTALPPASADSTPTVHLDGWNIPAMVITPPEAVADPQHSQQNRAHSL